MHKRNGEINEPKNVGYFCNFQKLPKVSNHPLGENSPTLVALFGEMEMFRFAILALNSALAMP
jgi:hypothetical protein